MIFKEIRSLPRFIHLKVHLVNFTYLLCPSANLTMMRHPVGEEVKTGSLIKVTETFYSRASPLQVVYRRLVGVREDVRRRDEDEDGPVHQEDRPGRGGDAGGHPLSDPPADRTRVLQQPVLPAQVGHPGLV